MRRVHKHQHGLNEHYAKNRENDTAHQRERHGRMDRTAQPVIIVLAKILTSNDCAAGADANAKANAELGEHHRGLNATQCELAAKLTDDIGTDKRVCLLKKRTKEDGNAQRQQLLPNDALRYIDRRRFLSHTPSPQVHVNRQNSKLRQSQYQLSTDRRRPKHPESEPGANYLPSDTAPAGSDTRCSRAGTAAKRRRHSPQPR